MSYNHPYRNPPDDFSANNDKYKDSERINPRDSNAYMSRIRNTSSEQTSLSSSEMSIFQPGKALSFLHSCGLDTEDLKTLAELPEHLITADALPELLAEIKKKKMSRTSSSRSSSLQASTSTCSLGDRSHTQSVEYPLDLPVHQSDSLNREQAPTWDDRWGNVQQTSFQTRTYTNSEPNYVVEYNHLKDKKSYFDNVSKTSVVPQSYGNYSRDSNMSSRGISQSLHLSSRGISQSSNISSRGNSQSSHLSGRGISQSLHHPGRDISQSSHLSSRDIIQSSHLSSRDISQSSHHSSRDVSQSSYLFSRGFSQSSHLSSRDVGLPSLLSSRDVGSPSVLSSQGIGSHSLMSRRDIVPPSNLSSRDIGPPSFLSSRDVGLPSLLSIRDLAPPSRLSNRDAGQRRKPVIHIVPTRKEASDFHGKTPPVFPYACVLCEITVLSNKDWSVHVKGPQHANSQLSLVEKYPEWDQTIQSARRNEPASESSKSRTTQERGGTSSSRNVSSGNKMGASSSKIKASSKNLNQTQATTKCKVVCVKFEVDEVDEAYLKKLLGQFGVIVRIIMFPKLAFVDMGTEGQAEDIVKYFVHNPLRVRGEIIHFSLSAAFSFLQSSLFVSFSPLPSGDGISSELTAIAKRFGSVKHSLFLPSRGYVEMANVEEANKLVEHYSTNSLKLKGKTINVCFSPEYQMLSDVDKEKSPVPYSSRRRRNSSPKRRSRSSRRDSPSPKRRASEERSRSRRSQDSKNREESRRSREKTKENSRQDSSSKSHSKRTSPLKDQKTKIEESVEEMIEEDQNQSDIMGDDSDLEGVAVIADDGEELNSEDEFTVDEELDDEEYEIADAPTEKDTLEDVQTVKESSDQTKLSDMDTSKVQSETSECVPTATTSDRSSDCREAQELQQGEQKELQQREQKELQQVEQKELQQGEQKELQQGEQKELHQAEQKDLQQAEQKDLQQAEQKDLQQGEQKELQQGEQKELQQAEQKDLQQGEQKELQQGEQKELQQGEQKELQQGEQKELQQGEQKELQQGEQKELQLGEQKELQQGEQKELQQGEQKELQQGEQKELQQGEQKELQEGEQKELQEGEQKALLEGEQKELQEGEQKELQEGEQKELQEGEQKELQHGEQKDLQQRKQKELHQGEQKDETVEMEEDWSVHVNGPQHANSQLSLVEKYPEWDQTIQSARRNEPASESSKSRTTQEQGGTSSSRNGSSGSKIIASSSKSESSSIKNLNQTQATTKCKVVCVIFEVDEVDEAYLKKLLGQFGAIVKVIMFTKLAFVEMGTAGQAEDIVKYFVHNPLSIRGETIQFSLSAAFSFLQTKPSDMDTSKVQSETSESVPTATTSDRSSDCREAQELQQGEQKELQQGEKKELQAEQKELQQAEQKELQQAEQKKLQQAEQKKLQRGEQKDLQRVEQKELQQGEQKDLQQGEQKELQQGEQKDIQRGEQKDLQRVEQKELQQGEQKELQQAEQKDVQRGEQKDLHQGEQKDLQFGEQKDLQRGEQKDLQRVEQKELQQAEQKDLQQGEQKELQQGEQKDETVEMEEKATDFPGNLENLPTSDEFKEKVLTEQGDEMEISASITEEKYGKVLEVAGFPVAKKYSEKDLLKIGEKYGDVADCCLVRSNRKVEKALIEMVDADAAAKLEAESKRQRIRLGGKILRITVSKTYSRVNEGVDSGRAEGQEHVEEKIEEPSCSLGSSEESTVVMAEMETSEEAAEAQKETNTDAIMQLSSDEEEVYGRVLRIRNLPMPDEYTDTDFLSIAEPYGEVKRHWVFRLHRTGLIEMKNACDAEKVVSAANMNKITVAGKHPKVSVSTKHAHLNKRYFLHGPSDGSIQTSTDLEKEFWSDNQDVDSKEDEKQVSDVDGGNGMEVENSDSVLEAQTPMMDPVGAEFVRPVVGYFCSLCNAIYASEEEAKNDHCRTPLHHQKLKEHKERNGS